MAAMGHKKKFQDFLTEKNRNHVDAIKWLETNGHAHIVDGSRHMVHTGNFNYDKV